MEAKSFFIQLMAVTGIVFLLLFLLGNVFQQNAFDHLSIGTILFFLALCPFLFFWAKQAAHSKDLNAFSRMAILSISLKMFLAILIVAAYVKIVQPESRFFLASFLLVYFSYTIFETSFMMKIGREKKED